MSTLSGGPNVVTNGLVLNLDAANPKSYVSGSTTWNDISRGGNNGTLVNGPIYNSSNRGVIVLDGTNDYIDCGPTSAIGSSLTGLTVSVWINSSVRGIRCIAENGSEFLSNTFYIFQENDNNFTFLVYGVSYDLVFANFVYQLDTWYNVVGTWSANSRAEIYSNGVICSGNRQGLVQSNVINGNTNLLLGSRNYGGYPFSGKYAQASVYNRALSAQEVLQNYNATKGRFGL